MTITGVDWSRDVTVSRKAFSQAFDAVAASNLAYKDSQFAALGLDGSAAFALAFVQARPGRFRWQAGGLSDRVVLPRFLERNRRHCHQRPIIRPDAAEVLLPQETKQEMARMLGAATVVRGLIEATRHVCLIDIDSVVRGAGLPRGFSDGSCALILRTRADRLQGRRNAARQCREPRQQLQLLLRLSQDAARSGPSLIDLPQGANS